MNEIETLFSDCLVSDPGIDNLVVDKSYLLDVHNNTVYNKVIVSYFDKLSKEDLNISKSSIGNLCQCNKVFVYNRYDYNLVKDFIYTKLCHNKFCNNCKKVKQACRMSRYIPELEPYSDKMYHIIFTLPNCSGSDLHNTLKKMSNSFRKLIRFINGTKGLSFINFSKYGYLGAIRSLEITFKGDSYHPHYHCAFAFSNLSLDCNIENVFSRDFHGVKDLRLFSEFEIILQKLWYMCLNDIDITKYNYDHIDLGYSVLCNKFNNNDYAELFKYMTKETDEINNILTYDNFKTLYYNTRFVKQIQGYGVFYRINDSNIDEEVDKFYANIQEYLNIQENPSSDYSTPFELLNDNIYTLISRKRIYQYLKDLKKSN